MITILRLIREGHIGTAGISVRGIADGAVLCRLRQFYRNAVAREKDQHIDIFQHTRNLIGPDTVLVHLIIRNPSAVIPHFVNRIAIRGGHRHSDGSATGDG